MSWLIDTDTQFSLLLLALLLVRTSWRCHWPIGVHAAVGEFLLIGRLKRKEV